MSYIPVKKPAIEPNIESVPSNPNIDKTVLKIAVAILSIVPSIALPIPKIKSVIPPRISPLNIFSNAAVISVKKFLKVSICLALYSFNCFCLAYTSCGTAAFTH